MQPPGAGPRVANGGWEARSSLGVASCPTCTCVAGKGHNLPALSMLYHPLAQDLNSQFLEEAVRPPPERLQGCMLRQHSGLSDEPDSCANDVELRWQSVAGGSLKGLAPRDFRAPAHEPNPFL